MSEEALLQEWIDKQKPVVAAYNAEMKRLSDEYQAKLFALRNPPK